MIGGQREDVGPRSGGGPDLFVGEQVGVDEDAQLGGMTERWHAADGKAGGGPHGIGVDPAALAPPAADGQLAFVELVRSAHIGEHDLAVDGENQTLHDLAHLDADGGSRIGGGLGPLGEPHRLDGDATIAAGVDDALHVPVQRLRVVWLRVVSWRLISHRRRR